MFFILKMMMPWYIFGVFTYNEPAAKDINLDAAAYDYIETYKDLAIVEMYRTGIPASITLAQGLHESNYGLSPLAVEANNHFGIKCKSYWTGQTYYHKDDDFNKRGEIIESCFRAYRSDLDSYVDRSNYLLQTERYKSLFTYGRTDYIALSEDPFRVLVKD
jgi:flagellum-specific peptidoglycan hydrolase FlgJ